MSESALSLLARTALPLLTRLPPEAAHDLGLKALKLASACLGAISATAAAAPGEKAQSLFGLSFAHPLGLAAGFDKNGDYLDALGALGFSHVELGTVTPRAQPGNPRPRMFRIRSQRALINRMGFNNKGVDHLIARLAASRYTGVRGVSIGKNADTPLELAHEDYLACLRKVYPLADYVAVNVSSPNTAGLRDLQGAEPLSKLLDALLEERRVQRERSGRQVALLVKIAPELTGAQINLLCAAIKGSGIDGVIATNTSTARPGLETAAVAREAGGLSGAPLHALSVKVIARLRAELGAGFPLIGVGGIVDAASALRTLGAGANLMQVYTGFAYRGPSLIAEVLAALPPS